MSPNEQMQTSIFPGRYVQAADALGQLAHEVEKLGEMGLIVAGGTAADSSIPQHAAALDEAFDAMLEPFGGECSDAEIDRLAEIAEGETIHHEPLNVTPDAVRAALQAADEFGRARKA